MIVMDKDYTGILVSSICIIHCLAGPIIIALGLSTAGLSFFLNEKVHLILVAPMVLLALWSLPNGYSQHKNLLAIILATIGIITLPLGLMVEKLF